MMTSVRPRRAAISRHSAATTRGGPRLGTRGTKNIRGWCTGMPAMVSNRGAAASRPTFHQRANSRAPGNEGMRPRTSTSQILASAPYCSRLYIDASGSTAFGNSFVTTRTRIRARKGPIRSARRGREGDGGRVEIARHLALGVDVAEHPLDLDGGAIQGGGDLGR